MCLLSRSIDRSGVAVVGTVAVADPVAVVVPDPASAAVANTVVASGVSALTRLPVAVRVVAVAVSGVPPAKLFVPLCPVVAVAVVVVAVAVAAPAAAAAVLPLPAVVAAAAAEAAAAVFVVSVPTS